MRSSGISLVKRGETKKEKYGREKRIEKKEKGVQESKDKPIYTTTFSIAKKEKHFRLNYVKNPFSYS